MAHDAFVLITTRTPLHGGTADVPHGAAPLAAHPAQDDPSRMVVVWRACPGAPPVRHRIRIVDADHIDHARLPGDTAFVGAVYAAKNCVWRMLYVLACVEEHDVLAGEPEQCRARGRTIQDADARIALLEERLAEIRRTLFTMGEPDSPSVRRGVLHILHTCLGVGTLTNSVLGYCREYDPRVDGLRPTKTEQVR